MAATSPGLAARALRGVRWNYLGAVGRIAATFISQIVLARLLGPEPFGLFGYAFLTVTLLALVVEMGLQNALMQVPQLDDPVVATAVGRLLLVSAIAATAVFALADMVAVHIFANAAAAPVLRAMAPTLVIGATSAAANAMLARDLEFKVIQLAALGSYVVGYLIVGITAALMGLGVWSLVLAWHVQTVLACAFMVTRSPRPLKPANPLRPLPVAGFGRVVMVTNMVNWVIDNGPHTAIGRWLGASSLGLYTVANNLVKVPADHLVRNLQTVLFPLAARAQGNDAGIRRAYLTVLGGVGVLSFPTFTFVALESDRVVDLLLGHKWHAAAAVLVPLSLAMVLHAVEAMCGPILGGRGEPRAELRYYEIAHGQHFDAFLGLPGFGSAFVPMQPYLLAAMDLMAARLRRGAPLPPSQVLRSRPRAALDGGSLEPLSGSNLGAIRPWPGAGDRITLRRGVLTVPD